VARSDWSEKAQRRLRSVLRERLAVDRAIAGQLLSLTSMLGRPVLNDTGTRVGRVSDVVVHWAPGIVYPRVTGVLVTAGQGFALVDVREIILGQAQLRLRSDRLMVARPVRREGDVALARDVLDHQLVDLRGVQVVRAAEVYLLDRPGGWELAAVDVGVWAFLRRLGPRRRRCPAPVRAINWADLQSFVPRSVDEALPRVSGPASAAGEMGGAVQLGIPASELRKLRAADVARVLSQLGRDEQAQVTAMAEPSAAADALRQLTEAQRDALLGELGEADRLRLRALLGEADPA
jgi:sporulation protein YlmC with PRC-barrel domain